MTRNYHIFHTGQAYMSTTPYKIYFTLSLDRRGLPIFEFLLIKWMHCSRVRKFTFRPHTTCYVFYVPRTMCHARTASHVLNVPHTTCYVLYVTHTYVSCICSTRHVSGIIRTTHYHVPQEAPTTYHTLPHTIRSTYHVPQTTTYHKKHLP